MIPVIMAGGSGTRLWPLSRTAFPKQFLALNSHLTMLQETAARLSGLVSAEPVVICNEEHRFLVAEQMRQQNHKASILLEPVGRNTAPAIALAAMQILRANGGAEEAPIMLILAADHVIRDTKAFQQAAMQLLPAVKAGKFGTLGIVPTEAATGYGYIKVGHAESDALFAVEQFVEKPDLPTAQQYFSEKTDSGVNKWLWNSGMFMIRADRYLAALKQYRPDIYSACEQAMAGTAQDYDFIRVDETAFKACPDESIDYAIMEPLSKAGGSEILVAPLDAGWSDVGSWSALWDIANKDENGNAVMVGGDLETDDVILQQSTNSFVSANSRMVTTLGVDNLVIVDTPDALLVASKDKVQDVKNIVAELKAQGRNQHHQHREVYRPWGKYDSVDHGLRYQVKRITVKPGAKLSVQMHHHRAEHWIVVSGTAKVTNGEKTFLVTENQSTYIPIGQVHCLENPGVIELEMIEVQSGSYLGEDDIVRLKDQYGRA
ncbi:mannose-1-phosphate guanylyltransferase/mannose-6-phosphate isomerase [Thalassolituus sp. LLYu03]|uniref:mannose-1-phosphate guanylyltransferase/mannose-6-phosphate isomerase n=1 Tax=Thalassolituus sp. LLYu03 TaxID=3421656 RepID=UPI003D2E5932